MYLGAKRRYINTLPFLFLYIIYSWSFSQLLTWNSINVAVLYYNVFGYDVGVCGRVDDSLSMQRRRRQRSVSVGMQSRRRHGLCVHV